MRFLSLLVLSGCALFDAAGDAHGILAGGAGYDSRNIPDTSPMPRLALAAELDGQPGLDVVVFDQNTNILACFNQGDGLSFACEPTGFTGFSGIAVDDLDGDGRSEVIAYGPATLEVLVPESNPVTFRRVDLSSKAPGSSHQPLQAIGAQLPTNAARSLVVAYDMPLILVIGDPLNTAIETSLTYQVFNGANATAVIATANVNGNGAGDELIAAPNQDSFVTEFSGVPLTGNERQIAGGGSARMIASGSFVNSAQQDLAFSHLSQGPGFVRVMTGTADGLSDTDVRFGEGTVANDFAAGDFDGDGTQDLGVLSRDNTGRHQLFRFTRITSQGATRTILDLEGNISRFTLGDLNSDGKADILLAPGNQGGVDYLLSR